MGEADFGVHDPWVELRLTALRMSRGEYLDQLVSRDLSEPVLVWQMGKVASRSFVDAIERTSDYAVFHLHHTDAATIEALREHHDSRQQEYPPNLVLSIQVVNLIESLRERTDRKIRIVSAVRDPLARNVSAFFMNLGMFAGSGSTSPAEAGRLTKIFLRKYPHSVPLSWFDRELKRSLGIDVYETPFDRDAGCLRITQDHFDLLVLRAEDDDSVKEAALNEFFDRDDIEITRTNVTSDGGNAQLYQRFYDELLIPDRLRDEMYGSRFARHFYTDEELNEMRAAWRTPGTAVKEPIDALAREQSATRELLEARVGELSSGVLAAERLRNAVEALHRDLVPSDGATERRM